MCIRDRVRARAFKDKEHRINLEGKSKQELLDILFEERGYEFMDEMQRDVYKRQN